MTPYYDEDEITIYHGDCFEVLPDIHPDSVSLVLTDPPYGINLDTDYAGRMHRSGPKRWSVGVTGDTAKFDPVPLLQTFSKALLFGANYYSDTLPVGSWLVWHKYDVAPVLSDCEMAWHNLDGKRVSYFRSAISQDRPRVHPTQKPVDLMRWILDRWTEPGQLILDPYMGSGPVAQACHEMGRRYIGVEIVEDYCRVAVDRLRQGVLAL